MIEKVTPQSPKRNRLIFNLKEKKKINIIKSNTKAILGLQGFLDRARVQAQDDVGVCTCTHTERFELLQRGLGT